jgi:uncharacterized protein (TIGR02145 family)
MVALAGCGGDEDNPAKSGAGGSEGCNIASYRTVVIEGQTGMAENLNCETKDSSWCLYDPKLTTKANADTCAKYGRLYAWSVAMKACPSGWRLPDTADWNKLVIAAGGTAGISETGGLNLKSELWGGTDSLGFSALPGGKRRTDGEFISYSYTANPFGYWWTSTEYDKYDAYVRYMNTAGPTYVFVTNVYGEKRSGHSVRCVKE